MTHSITPERPSLTQLLIRYAAKVHDFSGGRGGREEGLALYQQIRERMEEEDPQWARDPRWETVEKLRRILGMTRREWARGCLQDSGCPDDMLDRHLERLGIGDEPWTSPDDDASGGMMRHDERAATRLKVEEYAVELHGAEPVVVDDVMVGVFFAGGWATTAPCATIRRRQ